VVLISAKMKSMFFDRPAVIRQVDKDTLRLLRNAGGYARKTARSLIKRKGKARKAPKNQGSKAWLKWQQEILQQPASAAGSPPFEHSDDPNRTLRKILFAFVSKVAVVVGPVGLLTKRQFLEGAKTVAELQEKGGTKKILEKLVSFTDQEVVDGPAGRDSKGKFTKAPRRIVKGRRWVPLNGRARPGQPVRNRRATYPARPYMKPAVKKMAEQSRFKQLFFSTSGVG
jgi:hypothetical protein